MSPESQEFAHLFEAAILGWRPQEGDWSVEQMRQHLLTYPNGAKALCHGSSLVSLVFFQQLPGVVEILYLFTLSSSRGQGFMGSLLNVLFLEFNDREFWLEVRQSNQAAKALYLKWGFHLCGQRPHYYSDGSTALLMSRPASLSLK